MVRCKGGPNRRSAFLKGLIGHVQGVADGELCCEHSRALLAKC